MVRQKARGWVALAAGAAVLGVWGGSAQATFHLWKISEVFSNASGSVQFIEFQQPSFSFDDERFLTEASLSESTSSRLYNFPTDLPSMPNPNQHFLVATPGYAALPGVPAPDYVLPTNDWFNPSNDTILYAGGIDSITLTPGMLPTDGIHALLRENGASDFTIGTALVTNFAGVSGTVSVPAPEPTTLALGVAGAAVGLLRRRRRA